MKVNANDGDRRTRVASFTSMPKPRSPWKRRYVPKRVDPKVGAAGGFFADLVATKRKLEDEARFASPQRRREIEDRLRALGLRDG